MAKSERDVVFGAQIRQPVPAEYALNADNDVGQEWKDQLEKQFRIGFDVLMNPDFSFLVDDADIHFSCMQIDLSGRSLSEA